MLAGKVVDPEETIPQGQRAAQSRDHIAERGAGEMLAKMDRQKVGRPSQNSSIVEPILADLGITKKQSHRWQMADVSDDVLAAYVAGIRDAGQELTAAGGKGVQKVAPLDLGKARDKAAEIVGVGGTHATHGMRRTNPDKKRAVMTLLEDAEWSQWSDHRIARECAVHHEMVDRRRSSLALSASDDLYICSVCADTFDRGGTHGDRLDDHDHLIANADLPWGLKRPPP